ncbi:hypothetical protein [Salinicola acroporae]|uniref:hypothetical protein n=1 Tax=Salinicola acroporae TaxID=1541440 RepID=UPI002455D0D5|nr:hypothetical protein [Salinicola acroporae]
MASHHHHRALPCLGQRRAGQRTGQRGTAPWPAKAVEASQAQCRANITASGIEGPKVERYCECATKALQARFSAAEVRKMQRNYDPGDGEDSRPPSSTRRSTSARRFSSPNNSWRLHTPCSRDAIVLDKSMSR